MQSFNWINAINILLQMATVFLAARNHKAIIRAHKISFDTKQTAEANQEFIKDYLNQISRLLKLKI